MKYQIVITETHLKSLRNHFFSDCGTELAAFINFGVSQIRNSEGKPTKTVFLCHGLDLLGKKDLISVSHTHVTWDNSIFLGATKLAEASHLVTGIVHSHVAAPAKFSKTDDKSEADLCALLQNRRKRGAGLVSLVMDQSGALKARIWLSPKKSKSVDVVKVIGNKFRFFYEKTQKLSSRALVRQALAFGEALNSILAKLTITVVGCGGTGSATAMLLARLGVGTINLVDSDYVDYSNLNRLHGAGTKDAQRNRLKVAVVARHIENMGLGTNVIQLPFTVMNLKARDVIKNSDFIFGCTDDNSGRLLLNRFAYFYLVPVIDMGLAIELSKGEPISVQALDGRVTVLQPGATCLLCRGVINERLARAEFLKSINPAEYKRQKKEAYVSGEGNPNPSVVTFTTEVATMAVNEFLHRLTGFRGPYGHADQRTRLFHHMHDLRPGDKPREDCPVCSDDFYWGRGDVEPFLDQIW